MSRWSLSLWYTCVLAWQPSTQPVSSKSDQLGEFSALFLLTKLYNFWQNPIGINVEDNYCNQQQLIEYLGLKKKLKRMFLIFSKKIILWILVNLLPSWWFLPFTNHMGGRVGLWWERNAHLHIWKIVYYIVTIKSTFYIRLLTNKKRNKILYTF